MSVLEFVSDSKFMRDLRAYVTDNLKPHLDGDPDCHVVLVGAPSRFSAAIR